MIAAEAGAKVSFRLVPGQDPAAVVAEFREFVEPRLPPDAQADGRRVQHRARRRDPARQPLRGRGADGASDEYGRPAVLMGSGGSIPVVESMHRLLGLDSLLMGFGLEDDQVHCPNEKFEWRCFQHGIRAHARLLGGL